jgi:hypothetical protein
MKYAIRLAFLALAALILSHAQGRAAGRYDLMAQFGGPGGDVRAALTWLAGNPQPSGSFVSSGTYTYTGVLDIPAGADLLFDRTTLLPLDIANESVRLRGSGTKLTFSGTCRIGYQGRVTSRYGNAEASGIELESASNFTIAADDLTIEGTGSVGLFSYRRTGPGTVVGKITVISSGEDSFHFTDASHDIDLSQSDLYSYNSGDDGFAVVSYTGNPDYTRNIHWGSVTMRYPRWSRGISVVGGQNVTVDRFDIDGSSGAGIYIAAEALATDGYDTRGVQNVRMFNGIIRNPNTLLIHRANVVFYNDQPTQVIDDVQITVDADPNWPLFQNTGHYPVTRSFVNGIQ